MSALAEAPGVIGVSTRVYVEIADVMQLFGCKQSKASNYIKDTTLPGICTAFFDERPRGVRNAG